MVHNDIHVCICSTQRKIDLFLEDVGGLEKGRWDRKPSKYSLLGFLGLLGEKYSLDIGQYTSLGDGDTG